MNFQCSRFWVLITKVQRIIFPLGNNSCHLGFRLGDWQRKGINLLPFSNKYLKSSKNVYYLVSDYYGARYFVKHFTTLCVIISITRLRKSNLPKVTQPANCGERIQIQVSWMLNSMLLMTMLYSFGIPLLPDIKQANLVHPCFETLVSNKIPLPMICHGDSCLS